MVGLCVDCSVVGVDDDGQWNEISRLAESFAKRIMLASLMRVGIYMLFVMKVIME